MCLVKSIVLLSLITIVISSKQLPNYMKKCKYNTPDMNDCIVNSANVAIPYVIKGDKSMKIPKLDPLKIIEVVAEAGSNLKIKMHDVLAYGIRNVKILKAKIDNDKLTLDLVSNIPRLEIIGDYEMNGRILVLPIQGRGRCNITIENGTYYYNLWLKFVTKNDGKKYYEINDHKMIYDAERVYYKFDNLFNGDERLGKQMNQILNENWKELQKDLGSGIGETMAEVTSSILRAVFNVVPYEDIWEF